MINISKYIYDIVRNESIRHNVDPAIILAIIDVESGGNPNSINPSDPSYGLMQVKLETARNVLGDESLTVQQLMNPSINIQAGTGYFALQYSRYGNVADAIAAYNSGTVKFKNGRYINQGYVDKVMNKIPEYQSYVSSIESIYPNFIDIKKKIF